MTAAASATATATATATLRGCALAIAAAAAVAAPAAVPVMLERRFDLDSCAAGRVAHLKPVPGNTLSVRAGPGTGFAEIDRLPLGHAVLLCDANGSWHGIVYGADGADTADCAIPAVITGRQPYRGPCRSGWVSGRFIAVTAG